MPTEKQIVAFYKRQIKEYEEAAKNYDAAREQHPEFSTKYAAKAQAARVTVAALQDGLAFVEGKTTE